MSKRRFIHRATVALFCGAAITLLAGCESYEGRQAKVAHKADTSLDTTRQELVKADQEVIQTLAAMDQLESQPRDLRQAYRAFTSEVAQTTKQSKETREQAEKMREQWRKYINDWEQSIDRVRSPEVRAGASDRRQEVREEYHQIRDVAREFEQAYEPFLRHLRDIERTLSLDLTAQGVATAKPAFEAARQSGEQLRQQIDSFVAVLDRTTARRTTQRTETQQATEF
jgi:predicted  nucleic acid-binding Zn-ribbon protein